MWKKWIDRLAWTVLGIGNLIMVLALAGFFGYALYRAFVDFGVRGGLIAVGIMLVVASFVWVSYRRDSEDYSDHG